MVSLKWKFSAATGIMALSMGSLLANHNNLISFLLSVEQVIVSPRRTDLIPCHDNDASPHRPFPRWGDTLQEEETHGLDMISLLDFIVNSSAYYCFFCGGIYESTTDHKKDMDCWLPETLYVLDADGLWTSRLHRNISAHLVQAKAEPVEPIAMVAWRILHHQDDDDIHKWPRLRQLLVRQNHHNYGDSQLQAVGFPFLAWFGDFTECNRGNWKNGQHSIPLFTVAARVDCNYTFPFPNYQTTKDSKDSPQQWQEIMQNEYAAQYPWHDKLPQIFWRGGLTGYIHNATTKNPRWRMVQKIHELEQDYQRNSSSNTDNGTNTSQPFLFDVHATYLPDIFMHLNLNTSEVGEFSGHTPMTHSQKYRGILDIDGHSWSSRFGQLLCYNSVVLKVEPTWVDYFQFSATTTSSSLLKPWKHYIPVAADLSDLVERANYVIDPANDEFLQTMVQKANAWCREHLIHDRLARDMLDIWERYVELLDIGTPHWQHTIWKDVKAQIFAPDSTLDMVLLSPSMGDHHDVNTNQ